MDLTVAAKAVAGRQALGAARELGVGAGGGLIAGIIKRMRAVFGPDARSVDALEQARRDGAQVAATELASALAWYARQGQESAADLMRAAELVRWAGQAGHAGVTQQVRAGRDAYPAGQDQAVVHCRTSCD